MAMGMHPIETKNFHEKRYAKGEFIFKEGAWGDRIYEVKSGEILILRRSKNDQPIPIAKASAGDLFGEMYLLHKEHIRNASAVAATEVIVRVYFEDVIIQDLVNLTPRQRKLMEGLMDKLNKTTDTFVEQKELMMAQIRKASQAQEDSNNSDDSLPVEGVTAVSQKPALQEMVNDDKLTRKDLDA